MDKEGNKTGGRKKGTPNKSTTEIREAYGMLIRGNIQNLTRWLEEVANKNPAKALDILATFSKYVIPSYSSTEIKGEVDSSITFNIIKSYDSDEETNKGS